MAKSPASRAWPPGVELRSSATSPLGAIKIHGYVPSSPSMRKGDRRKLGRYALVYCLRGRCDYWDEINGARVLGPGDAFLLFPEVVHRYGPADGSDWDELFLVFEGPAFDLLRDQGLLDPKRPFLHLEPVPLWRRRIESCLDSPGRIGQAAVLRQVFAVQSLLADALERRDRGDEEPPWIEAACAALSTPGALQIRLPELAASLGVSFETFRKRFAAVMGASPGEWRSARMVEAAARLLAEPGIGGREIADRLGFTDEYHFSKRFRALSGMTPTEYRRRSGR